MKLTFSGGKYPAVATHSPLEDWTVYNSFKADVTASRTCLVAFRVVREDDKEHRGWVKLALVHQGRNAVVDVAPTPRGLDNGRPLKGPTQLEIIMYAPHKGEVIFVDNIRVSTEVPDRATPPHGEHVAPGSKVRFYPKLGKIPVLGLGIEVASAAEFGKQMMEHWVPPQDKTIEQAEAELPALYEGLKKEHPRAVMAIFRNGQKGFDPAAPRRSTQAGSLPASVPTGPTRSCWSRCGALPGRNRWRYASAAGR